MSERIGALFNPSRGEKRSHMAAQFCDSLYVDIAQNAPDLARGGAASLARARFDRLPVIEHHIGCQVDAHGNQSHLTCQDQRFRTFCETGNTDRRMRLLKRLHVKAESAGSSGLW